VIQTKTMVDISDNSGVKVAQCIRVLGKNTSRRRNTRSKAVVGDIICVAIKKWLPTCQLNNKKVHRCVVIRTKQPVRRPDGSYVQFDRNAAVIIDTDGNPVGTRIFGAVARELREKNFMKIISLAAEVV
jgi:large subunit ribosomal protein L14